MSMEIDLWRFIARRLTRGDRVTLLVVAESSGSSPGRAGYKMAVAADGELMGSIGGGVMEMSLVEQAKALKGPSAISEQVHRKNVPDSSGMICSGKQTVIFTALASDDLATVETVIAHIRSGTTGLLSITSDGINVASGNVGTTTFRFERRDNDFVYEELLGERPRLFIVGGGHCSLALSELASKIGFGITIFDDRPDLNTLVKNEFADEITIIESYDMIAKHIQAGPDVYVVVMTLGYASDAVVIRRLIGHDLRYFGVLGSKAKMATLLKELGDEGFDSVRLTKIRTPIGLPINSRTPEEIAISIMAEIILVKNALRSNGQ